MFKQYVEYGCDFRHAVERAKKSVAVGARSGEFCLYDRLVY
jgi:hypothetical protein